MERYAEGETESRHISSSVLSPCDSKGEVSRVTQHGDAGTQVRRTQRASVRKWVTLHGQQVSNRRFIIRSTPSSPPAPHLPLSLQFPQSEGRGNVF